MQGQLSEIDIRSILQLIELGQRTGELFVETYGGATSAAERAGAGPSQRQFWFVFFLNGQIVYATDPQGGASRLRDYLHRYGLEESLDDLEVPAIASINEPEYGYLWALLENHILEPDQGRSILQGMVNETLFDLLGLHQGSFTFEMGPALMPQLTTLPIATLVPKVMKQMQEWKQFHPHIRSPHQCPVLSESERLREALPSQTFAVLDRWAKGSTSIRQMARYLNRDTIVVARAIYPYVQQGLVQLVDRPEDERQPNRIALTAPGEDDRPPRIACIEDSATVRKAVEQTLHQIGYDVVALENPLKALGLLFQIKPDLILCDIAMPELDGYEICAMLRQSTAFRRTPIVMLTGKDGFIDRIKARVVGATDYLTKPFKKHELQMLVEKYAGAGRPRPSPAERAVPSADG